MARKRPAADTQLALLHQRQAVELGLSPDGTRALVVVRWCDLEDDRIRHALVLLHVAKGQLRLLTAAARNDTQPSWTPDGRGVVLVSDASGRRELWLQHLPDDGSERLTDCGGLLGSPQVSPNGKLVAFLHAPALRPRARPNLHAWTRRDAASAEHTLRGHAWVQLWLLDLRSRRRRRLTAARGDVTAFAWSPSGRDIAFVLQREPLVPESAELWRLRTAGGGRPRRLGRQRGPKLAPSWSPDGESIAYVGHGGTPGAVEPLHVWKQPARGGKPADLLLDADLHCAVAAFDGAETCTPPVWSADGKRLYFLGSRDGSVDLFGVSAAGGHPVVQTSGRHTLTAFSSNGRRDLWALLREDARHPADVYVANGRARRARGAKLLQRVTRLQAPAAATTRLQEFHVVAPQGHRIHGFLLRGGRRRGPALLVLHGGTGAMAGWSFQPELQILAAAGYHVFCANIRGSSGYGRAHLRGLVGRWGVEDLADVHAVADWIEAQPFVDPRRVGLLGSGDGGYLAHWALGHTGRFRCAVTTGGATHLVALHGTSPMGPRLRDEFSVPPWEAHERYWRTSPLAFVEHLRTPLLIVQGERDRRCPPAQAQELYTALAHLGRDVELLLFAEEDESLPRQGKPHSRRERLRRILEWLERKL